MVKIIEFRFTFSCTQIIKSKMERISNEEVFKRIATKQKYLCSESERDGWNSLESEWGRMVNPHFLRAGKAASDLLDELLSMEVGHGCKRALAKNKY